MSQNWGSGAGAPVSPIFSEGSWTSGRKKILQTSKSPMPLSRMIALMSRLASTRLQDLDLGRVQINLSHLVRVRDQTGEDDVRAWKLLRDDLPLIDAADAFEDQVVHARGEPVPAKTAGRGSREKGESSRFPAERSIDGPLGLCPDDAEELRRRDQVPADEQLPQRDAGLLRIGESVAGVAPR